MTVRVSKPKFNLREKISELDKPSGIKGNELLRSDTTQDARDLIGAGRRNFIINGDFQVSQRADYTTSAVTAGHDTYWLDRWMSLKSGTTSKIQRVTRTVNGISQYAARIECTVAGTGIMGFNQRVELSNIPVGRILTASAMVRTNHPYVGFRTNTFQGTGGDRGVKAISDGEWQRIYWTFDSTGTTSNLGGDLLIVAYNNTDVSIAVGDFIEIAEVQLEVGKVATEFEHRSFAEELELCRRYFQRIKPATNYMQFGVGFTYGNQSDGNSILHVVLPTPMRAAPSFSYLGNLNQYYEPHAATQQSITNMTLVQYDADYKQFDILVVGTTSTQKLMWISTLNNTDTGLLFDAEL